MTESLQRRDANPLPQETLKEELLRFFPWGEKPLNDLKDHNLPMYGHSLRAAIIVRALGEFLNLSSVELLQIEIAALLHDVGKVKVPNSILNNTNSELDEDQEKIMQAHTTEGFNIVSLHDLDIARIIVSHHEDRQETVYPRKSSREAKDPLELQKMLVSLADKTDAGLSERSYKAAWDRESVFAYLTKSFDPILANVAIESRLRLTQDIFIA